MRREVWHALDRMTEPEIVREVGWDAFLRYKVGAWRRQPDNFRARFSLLQYLGMTFEEYGDWVTEDKVSYRVKGLWL